MANPVRKIRLKKSILIKGSHTEKGSVLACPAPLAQSLVGDGVAEYHEDHADEVTNENRLGVTVHSAHNDDPEPTVVEPRKPKAKSGS